MIHDYKRPSVPQTAREASRAASRTSMRPISSDVAAVAVSTSQYEGPKAILTPVPPSEAESRSKTLSQAANEREGTILQEDNTKFKIRPWKKEALARIDRLKGGIGGTPQISALEQRRLAMARLLQDKVVAKTGKPVPLPGNNSVGGSVLGSTVQTLPSFGDTAKSLAKTAISDAASVNAVVCPDLETGHTRATTRNTLRSDASKSNTCHEELLDRIAELEAKVISLEKTGSVASGAKTDPQSKRSNKIKPSMPSLLETKESNTPLGQSEEAEQRQQQKRPKSLLLKSFVHQGRLKTPKVVQHRRNSLKSRKVLK